MSKLGAEFLGTFMLVFVVGLNLTEIRNSAGFVPISIGFALMVLVYALGPISGAHLNPAVTFSVVLQNNNFSWNDGVKYLIAQCLGGACAGLATGFMVGFNHTGAFLGPKHPSTTGDLGFVVGAPLAEFFYTFLLCFVVLNVCEHPDHKEPKNYYGVAIGFVIIAGRGAADVSGGTFNPAVALGVNFMGASWKDIWLPIYWAAQLAGGFAAVTALHIVRPSTKKTEGQASCLTQLAYRIESMFDPEDTAEFLGTFFICLTITLNHMMDKLAIESLSDRKYDQGSMWSVGASFMVMVFALGDVSGGVFNPALTIAFCARWLGTGLGFGNEKLCDPRKSFKEMYKYFLAQLLGGAAGVGGTMLIYMFSGSWPSPQVGPIGDHTMGQAFFAETFGTFLLCYVVLSVASTSKPLKEYTGLVVGGCIIAAGYSFGEMSGGYLNPAVTLANSIGAEFQLITDAKPITFMLAQCIGGVLSAAVFIYLTHSHEFEGATSAREPLIAGN